MRNPLQASSPALIQFFWIKILHITCFNHTPSTYANFNVIFYKHHRYTQMRIYTLRLAYINITGYPFILHIVEVLPQCRFFFYSTMLTEQSSPFCSILFISYSHKVTITGPQMRIILYDLSVISFIVLAFCPSVTQAKKKKHVKAFHSHKNYPKF